MPNNVTDPACKGTEQPCGSAVACATIADCAPSSESRFYRGSIAEWHATRAWGQRLIGQGPDETAIALTALGDVDMYIAMVAEWRPKAGAK